MNIPSTGTSEGQPVQLLPRPGLRILLVDDDPMLLNSLRDVLEGDGHHVTATDGGRHGIDAFAAVLGRPEIFNVVITDLGMPHIDGRKVASAVHQISPD